MMLRLLVVSLSLFALGSAQGPQGMIQLGEHPLVTTMIQFLNQTIPCTGPCALDSIDYIIGEIVRGEEAETAQCVGNFVQDLENSFVPPPPGVDPGQAYAMQFLQSLESPTAICPKLDRLVSCFGRSSANVCGSSSQAETERILKSVISFLDCGVPVTRQLHLLECVFPVMTIFAPAPPPGYNNFLQCIDPALNYFGQGYDRVYRDISGSNFNVFEGYVRSLLRCFIQWNPSTVLSTSRCNNAVAHINMQLESIMSWLRDGAGRSMFTCLGDLTLYQDQNFERCINTFVTDGGELIRRVSDAIQTGNMANIRGFLRDLAIDTCRTQAVPELLQCLETVLVSRPSRRCSEVVLPTARHIYMPSLQYVYLLGGCSGRISGGALQAGVCQCARNVPDYSFIPQVSQQCRMDQTRSYEISFTISNVDFRPNDVFLLKADIQPTIDALYRGIYRDQFVASENYRFRDTSDGVEVYIDLVFYETVNTDEEELLSALPGRLVGNRGFVYEVNTAPPVILSLQTIIIIVVVGVVGVMLIIVLLVCCCCNDSGCSWCCPGGRIQPRGMQPRGKQRVIHEHSVVSVPATKYMYPGVHPGLCVQQPQMMSPYGQQPQMMSPYGQCGCQSPPTKTILQFQ